MRAWSNHCAAAPVEVARDERGAPLPFYRDVFGLTFLFGPAPTFAFPAADGFRIILSTRQGAGTVGHNSILYFKVTEIAATHAAMVTRGAKAERAPQLAPGCLTTSYGSRLCETPMAT
jgi:predicted enzyme related to lactoylglutathione lyase